MDLVSNNRKWLICHKTKLNQTPNWRIRIQKPKRGGSLNPNKHRSDMGDSCLYAKTGITAEIYVMK